MPLTVQLLFIMVTAAVLVAFLAGEITRHFGKEAYLNEMQEPSQRMVSLI